jgi:hypothetical protein
MTAIDPNTQFTDLPTPEARWQEANSLFLSYHDFAVGSHLWDRMYGVISHLRESAPLEEFNTNICVREALWKVLREVTRNAEKAVGFNFSPMYHVSTIPFPWESFHRTAWPGIEAVDVIETWVDHNLTVALSPFILNPVPMTVTTETYATIPRSLVGNPNELILRRESDYGTYKIRSVRLNGTDWELTLDVKTIPYDALSDVVVAQHAKFCYVDVTLPTMTGELYPVYSDTNQMIPQAKPYEDQGGGIRRYWFYPYAMVDPAFLVDEVNLTSGEFYKLLQSVEFRELQTTEQKARLYKRCIQESCTDCDCEDVVYQMTTNIVNAAKGILAFTLDGKLTYDPDLDEWVLSSEVCPTIDKDTKSTYELVFYYKTNPQNLSESHAEDLANMQRAILHKVAAELPVRDCGCALTLGFIFEAQQTYGKMTRTFGGDTIVSTNYGDRHGQHVYREIINNVRVYRSTNI